MNYKKTELSRRNLKTKAKVNCRICWGRGIANFITGYKSTVARKNGKREIETEKRPCGCTITKKDKEQMQGRFLMTPNKSGDGRGFTRGLIKKMGPSKRKVASYWLPGATRKTRDQYHGAGCDLISQSDINRRKRARKRQSR